MIGSMLSILINPWLGTLDRYGTGTSFQCSDQLSWYSAQFAEWRWFLGETDYSRFTAAIFTGCLLVATNKTSFQSYFRIYREWFWKTVVYSVFMTNKVMGKYRSTGVVKNLELVLREFNPGSRVNRKETYNYHRRKEYWALTLCIINSHDLFLLLAGRTLRPLQCCPPSCSSFLINP